MPTDDPDYERRRTQKICLCSANACQGNVSADMAVYTLLLAWQVRWPNDVPEQLMWRLGQHSRVARVCEATCSTLYAYSWHVMVRASCQSASRCVRKHGNCYWRVVAPDGM